jgi:hypothetical protein
LATVIVDDLAAIPLPPLHHAGELLVRDPAGPPLPGHTSDETIALVETARWVKDYLTRPHPELGRSGDVCPWVETSIRERLLFLTALRDAGTRKEWVERVMARLGQHLLDLEPRVGKRVAFKAIIALFPHLPAAETPALIDGLHARLKPCFVDQGLMLGEFYPTCDKPGLRNPGFRPLRSRTPLLVIRFQVPSDLGFLVDRWRYVCAYLRTLGSAGCEELRRFLDAHEATLAPAQREWMLEEARRVTTSASPVAAESSSG